MKSWYVRLCLTAVAVVVIASPAVPGAASDVGVPGRTNIHPSIAATGRFVAMTWGATAQNGDTDIYAAVSRDGGRTFEAPRSITDSGARANVGAEQPPRITLVPRPGKDPAIAVVWTSKSATGTRLLISRSEDGGRSFSRGTPLPGGDAAGNRGWESIAVDATGRVVAVWLDHRALARPADNPSEAQPAPHQHTSAGTAKADGAARAQLSKLYFATDGSSDARALTGGVCYCCKTTIATGAQGAVYAAWRHVYPGNFRDIAFTMSRDGGNTFSPPVRVSEDHWALDGCPENGPALAVGAKGRIHVVWPTLVPAATPTAEPTMALFHATSPDGRRFGPRQRLPTAGVPRHAQLTLDPRGNIVAAWEEQSADTRRVVLARGVEGRSGAIVFTQEIVNDIGPAATPALATTSDGVVAVWVSGAAGKTVLRVWTN